MLEAFIAHAAREHRTRLDLSWLWLTSLPDTVGDLGELRRLDLSYNALPALPESLRRLRKLEVLNLYKCGGFTELLTATSIQRNKPLVVPAASVV
ncbi:MAG TPA: hypothetical protein VFS21_38630 [Roseiflexaceae bacterium]|nr:hypothetical protein [Roseiflexaceae bacterium]